MEITKINIKSLPTLIVIVKDDKEKTFILKANKDKTKIFLNEIK